MIIIDKQLDFVQPTQTEEKVNNFENKVLRLARHLNTGFQKKVKYCLKKKLLQRGKSFNRKMFLIQERQVKIYKTAAGIEKIQDYLKNSKDTVFPFSPHCVAH